MKRGLFVSLGGLLVATAACAAFFVSKRSTTPGVLTVTPSCLEYTAGTGASNRVELTVTNSGGRPIMLNAAMAGCACTSVVLPQKRMLQPGEEDVLWVTVEPPAYGSRESYIDLVTDSLPVKRVPVLLRGKKLDPPYVRHAPSELLYEFTAGAALPRMEFEVLCVEPPGPTNWLSGFTERTGELLIHGPTQVEVQPVADEAVMKRYRFRLAWEPSSREQQSLATTLMPMTASASKRSDGNIHVRLKAASALEAIPSQLVFVNTGGIERTPSTRRRVILRSITQDKWRISDVRTTESWLTAVASAPSEDPKGSQSLEIEIDPQIFDREVGPAAVEVHTTHPHCGLISIDVRVAHSQPVAP